MTSFYTANPWITYSMQNKSGSTTHSILVVDDHPLVCSYLDSLIEATPHLETAGIATSFEEAQRLLDETSPSLAIIDLSLGNGSGLGLIKRIKTRHPDTKSLVFSAHDEVLYAPRALNAGALGFVSKQEDIAQITEAIDRVLEGKIWLSEKMSERLLHDMFQDGENPDIPSVSLLSDRELQVFELIGRGIKTTDIAEKLHLSRKTVETHRDKAKKKLGLRSGLELTRYAMQWVMEKG